MNSINQEGSSYLVAKEIFVTNQLVFYFQRNHFLAEIFDEKLRVFLEAGLVKKFLFRYVDMRLLKSRTFNVTRSPLSLSHLRAVFQVFFAGLLLAISVFFAERIVRRCRTVKR